MHVINLTPHALSIFLPAQVVKEGSMTNAVEGAEPVLTLPSAGFARAKEIAEQLAPLDLGCKIPVIRKSFSNVVEGLPDPQGGTIYIVSFLTAQAVPTREDVFFPGEAVRDSVGNIVGCVGLAHA